MNRAIVPIADAPIDFVDREGKSGIPSPSLRNTTIAIKMLGLDCRYDVFHDRYSIEGTPFGNSAIQVSDRVARQLRIIIRDAFKFDPGKWNASDGLKAACEANAFHPVLDYLDGCEAKWDGVKRLDTWIIDYMGATDTPFVRAVGRLMLIASVRRVRQPGCKFDYMCVLQSPEGKGKSSGLSTLYGEENFSDQTILGLPDEKVAERTRGRWCIECSELVGMPQAEIEPVKAMITRQTDRVRRAWGIAVEDVGRTNVFWGTTNDEEYLRANSGENRRFLPITDGEIDVVGIARDRDQLWAEASLEEITEPSLALPQALWGDASAERATRMQDDPWAAALENVADDARRGEQSSRTDYELAPVGENDGFEERVTSAYVLGVALGLPVERQTPAIGKRAAKVMRSLGWSKPTGGTCRINGRTVRGYVRSYGDPFADLM